MSNIVLQVQVHCLVWQGAGHHQGVEHAQQKTNKEIKGSLQGGLGIFLAHPELQADSASLYRKDGIHLLDSGLDIVIEDIQQGLLAAMSLFVVAMA